MQLHVGTQLDRLLRQPFARRHHHAPAAGRRGGVDLGLQVDRLCVRVRQGQVDRPFEHVLLARLEDISGTRERAVLHADEMAPVFGGERRDRLREMAFRVRSPHAPVSAAFVRERQDTSRNRIRQAVFGRVGAVDAALGGIGDGEIRMERLRHLEGVCPRVLAGHGDGEPVVEADGHGQGEVVREGLARLLVGLESQRQLPVP